MHKTMTWFPWVVSVALCCSLGCDSNVPLPDGKSQNVPEGRPVSLQANQSSTLQRGRNPVPARTRDTILIASFNIQAFGPSKMEDRVVMSRIADIIRKFDVVAIQEIRSADQRLLPRLIDYINADGMQYEYLLGPRLGRTTSMEQYAYVYDTTRILASPDASYTVNDGHPGPGTRQEVGREGIPDLLHREPLVARFVVRASNPFRFTLINIHTDPDEVSYELNVLDDVYKQVCNYEFAQANEDDVILLGDLNAAPEKFGELGAIPGLKPTIVGQPTNVRETALYDNILLDPSRTSEFTGKAGVLHLKDAYSLSPTDVERISDHNPIWAEFRVNETGSNPQMANRNWNGSR